MFDRSRSEATTNEGNARRLVAYAREQAEPTLRAERSNRPDELPADLFPGYTIIDNVSRGAQGRVYEAIDNTTQRRVAIKVLRSGPFGGDSERDRFEREIRLLAQLQHPNIVTIHSSGAVALQRYFVMDFIDGQPLDEYIRGNHLTIEQTLDLFLRICEAVNAAHLRGIIHRDLKPGNISIDGHGEPHVLDFGLAKLLSGLAGEDTDSLDATVAGQFIGSLPWAAPEQLMNTAVAIDLRTDVYGLGLLLYFMLTQSFPFDRHANLRDLTDDILRSEPVSPRSIRREIDDELNTIVLKCLTKEPDRRYQIAGELARDIRRYRAGEPIEAKRDSAGYLLVKTIRRHRGLAALAAALVLTSLVYAVTMSLLYRRAVHSERLADERAVDVHEQYETTREAMDFLVGEVSTKLNESPGNTRIRRDILEGAFERLLPLVQERSNDPRLRNDLMRTHYQLGDIAIALTRYGAAEDHLRKALELRLESPLEELASPDAQAQLSVHYVLLGDAANHQGELGACIDLYQQALTIDEWLASQHPENASYQDNLAWSYDRLGALAMRLGNVDEAQAFHTKQLAIMEQLVDDDPENPVRLHGLAEAHTRLGQIASRKRDWPAATHEFEQAVEVGRRVLDAGSADPLHWYAQISRLCTYDAAVGMVHADSAPGGIAQEACDLARRLVRRDSDVPRNHDALTQAEFRKVMGLIDGRDPAALEQAARELLASIDAYLDIADLTPSVAWRRSHGLFHLSRALQMQGFQREASDLVRQAVESVDSAIKIGVDSPELRIHRADMLCNTPDSSSRQRIAAIDAARDSVDCPEAKPAHIASVGRLYYSVGEFASAVELLEAAEHAYKSIGADLPADDARLLRECRSLSGD